MAEETDRPAADQPGAAERAVAAIAARQRGLITTAQLQKAGITERGIAHRVSVGRLHRLHRGVYAVGHRVLPPLARELGAVLACGPGAVLSHHAAAALWGLRPSPSGEIDVTLPGRKCASRPGIRVHRAATLDARDVRRRHGISSTAPARTLLDIAGELPIDRLRRAVDEAKVQRLVTDRALRRTIERASTRRGAAALMSVLSAYDEPAVTQSEAEELALRLIARAGLPRPEVNATVGPYRVDFLWRRERLVLEIDGWAFHGGRARFEADRRRDAEIQATGLTVSRATWLQLTKEPEAFVVRLALALRHRG